ncbi:MAG TPA: site-2 protease family protein [Thermoanaerobaculia bacterium]|jgi:Zn-dependent protease|nr:site-2 protease family protein [Thermoanaerobaculia bacterium]
MTPDQFVLGLTWFVVFIFSTTLHEAGHAFAAYRMGDPTAYHGGQVSLNPWPHIRRAPFGMVVAPLVALLLSKGQSLIGWASAPYDPHWAARHHRRAAIMAAAGPAANLLLVLLSFLAIRLGYHANLFAVPQQITYDRLAEAVVPGSLAGAFIVPLSIFFTLNILLFVFNLLPLPPLDGSALPPLFLSDQAAETYLDFLHQPQFALIGIIVAWQIFDPLFTPVIHFAINHLYPGVTYNFS